MKDLKVDEFSPATMNLVLQEWVDWRGEQRVRFWTKKKEIAKRYGRAVKVQRARRVLGQKQLAEMLGVNHSIVAKIEIGVILPSPRIHAAIIQLFRSTPEIVMTRHFKTMRNQLKTL